ncbi:MAG: glycine cleavage system aminomethyltransferase GcvT [Saprospiraceae bacterium]|nr:glycine cleavage system aminomethyltransferase GcvT [Saprospiraceae bacterium]MDW8484171.1 glycine cleavage system aminomethyltransferase GcvT [Saprospiraceae bacterium]
MKNTPLTERHIALGAKMAEFAGYNMPIFYTSITDEHHAVRNGVGIFDISHMGEFIVRGKEALRFLQHVTVNDVSRLKPGDVQYSCIPNRRGGIVDDLLIYRLDDVPEMTEEGIQTYMLVVNAANEKKDWRWLQRMAKNFDVQLKNISDRTGLIAVQGPKAAHMLQALTDIDLANMKYYTFKRGTFAGCQNVIISATGYTGAGGFEIYARKGDIVKIWDEVMAHGSEWGLKPAGLGARDTLRLEKGYCLYGNDINDKTSPLEAGLGWITKLNKVEDFPSKDRFLRQKEMGVKRKLVGFLVEDRRVPRHGYEIQSPQGTKIGVVTSGTHSPTLDRPIGMGYVKIKYAQPGARVVIVASGGKKLGATVTKLPFL